MLINPKYLTMGKLSEFDIVQRVQSLYKEDRLLFSGGAGAILGAGKAAGDDVDDGVVSSAVKVGTTAAASVGVDYGVRHISKKLDDKISEEVTAQGQKKASSITKPMEKAMGNSKSRKMQGNFNRTKKKTISRGKVKEIKAGVATKKRLNGWLKKGKVGGMVGLGAFALASVMDTSQDLSHGKQVGKMTQEQERNLERKAGREKQRQQEQAYGNINMGQMAIDMFNERTGHWKMGNAKFQ